MGIAVGIDLGTTNSAMGITRISTGLLRNQEGEELTPSCVTILENSEPLVGKAARDLAKQYPKNTVSSVKRLIGRDFQDPEVRKILKENPYGYTIEADSDDSDSIRIPLAGNTYTPEDISSMILRKIVRDAKDELRSTDIDAVVTVPAYFSDRQKFATRAACEQAGIKLLRLLSEPTAAAVAFGLAQMSPEDSKTIMVFDLGGGTFDVSVLSIAGGHFMEVTKGGDMWLGGDDIDRVISNYVFEQTEKNTGCRPVTELLELMSPGDRARFVVEVKEQCERAKIELGTATEATIESFGLLRDEGGKLLDVEVTITREKFEELLAPTLTRLTAITETVLEDIRFEPGLIDMVLMVGGSSMIPAIQNTLRQKFGEAKVHLHPRPMFAVAEGAAQMAHRLAQGTEDSTKSFCLMHSAAHDYYLQLAGGKRHRLVARNTPLPFYIEEKLVFAHDNQTLARLKIFNDIDGVLEGVGELWFHRDQDDPLSSYPNKTAKTEIKMGFAIDEDNIIRMRTWRVDQPEQKVESMIARGGIAMRLYSDLEATISKASSLDEEHSAIWQYLSLSKLVCETINNTSDPMTGAINPDIRARAFRQIETLRSLAENESYPLGAYFHLKSLMDHGIHALPLSLQKEITKLHQSLTMSLRELQDAEAIKADSDCFDSLIDEDTSDLYRVSEASDLIMDGANWPTDARRLNEYLKQLGHGHETGNITEIERARNEIDQIIDNFTAHFEDHNRGFDRDVVLCTQ